MKTQLTLQLSKLALNDRSDRAAIAKSS